LSGERVREALTIENPPLLISLSDLIVMWLIQGRGSRDATSVAEIGCRANAESPFVIMDERVKIGVKFRKRAVVPGQHVP
jgi:hypothetical protein